jgi:hypothetical protein
MNLLIRKKKLFRLSNTVLTAKILLSPQGAGANNRHKARLIGQKSG